MVVAAARGAWMSNRHVNLVLGVSSFGHASRRQVMHVLADHADIQGKCFPGLLLLEQETELSKRTLVRCLSDLDGEGWIQVDRSSVGPRRRGNQYSLNLKKLKESQRIPNGAMVALMDEAGSLPEDESKSATVTPLDQHIDDANGATVTPLMVPKSTSNGAKSASLYRRTIINHHRKGENKAPPSIAECAKAFFKRIAVVAPKSTSELAGDAISILVDQNGITPWEAMLCLEQVAVAAQARGEVINNFWFADDKWKGNSAPKGISRPDPTIGMGGPVVDEIDAELRRQVEQAENAPDGADREAGIPMWLRVRAGLQKEVNKQSFDTWIAPLRAEGVLQDVLYVRVPTADFKHVGDRYEEIITKYLPPNMKVQMLSATGVSA